MMSNNVPLTLTNVYTEYIRLRREGWSMEAVVKALRPIAEQLTQDDLNQLNNLVKQWESREASATPVPPGTQAPSAPPPAAAKLTGLLGRNSVVRPLPPRKEEAGTGASTGSAPAGGKQFCPNCGKPNSKQDNYCYACGHLLQASNLGGTRGFGDSASDQRTKWGTAYLSSASFVVLVVRGGSGPIRLQPRDNEEITLGRVSPDNPVRPNVDLSAFNAEELGVSRIHASIRRYENTVQIMDLSSKNHTYVNGQRLYPRESRVMRDGDEVRLGRLPMTVIFKHADR